MGWTDASVGHARDGRRLNRKEDAMNEKGQLVLSRKAGERIMIEGGIVIQVTRVKGDRAWLGVVAPGRQVMRTELLERKAVDGEQAR
jgi:carbon storage regulator CsrA